jgi:hypothetical protein
MDQLIAAGDVNHVRVTTSCRPSWIALRSVVEHELSSERSRELAVLLEQVVVDAVRTWASA